MIGSLGEIVFEVSTEQIFTFNDLTIQRSAKYSSHAIHGRKELLEFTGFAPVSMSMNVVLNAALGINPLEELEGLQEIFTSHEAVLFILNGVPQGDNLWVIESLNEKYDDFHKIGIPQYIEVSLSLKEYVEVNPESNSQEISQEEFENDYNGIGNW
ncbi:MAG: phage tail protein [Synergistaceae bacterium]|nr:phage tail protein [Synergistaceae bacterium]MBQ6738146.1 phage tail protein [Synergistaceae bacterium]MBR0075149.1 phage tail protein [Synergistaceae bacterium]MBR0234687.1 phage tail protein [Synergistaceae bacterium]